MLGRFLVLVGLVCLSLGQDISGSLELPALGRPFTLGSLYDLRQDKLVAPGVKLWDSATLRQNVLKKHVPYTNTAILASNSLEEKALAFDMQAELKASFWGDMVKVSGAAEYLKEETQSNYVAEVSFQYRRRTHMEELSMEHLAKVDHPSVFDTATEATHVVTRIVYGGNAVFTFKRTANSYSDKEEIHGKLKLTVQLAVAAINGKGSLDLTEEEKKNYNQFECKFHGDVSLTNPPTTFLEAVQSYRTLPSLINETTAIPMKVYLYPLSKLDSKHSRIVRRISANLLSQVERRMEDYGKLRREIGDLRESNAYKKLPTLKYHVEDFNSALGVHRNNFQRELLRVLPKIRGRGLEEIELTKVLDEGNSSFSMAHLKRWTSVKKREAGALKSLTSWHPELILTESGKFEELLFNDAINNIITINLQLYPETDPYVTCMRNRCANSIQYISWMHSRLNRKLRSTFSKFKLLHKFNQEYLQRFRTKFAVLENPIENEQQANISVEMYSQGVLAVPNLIFPVIENVTLLQENCNETRVSWAVTETNSIPQLGQGVFMWYRKFSAENWTKIHSRVSTNSAVLNISGIFELILMQTCSFGICAVRKFTVQDTSPAYCKNPVDCELSLWSEWSHCSAQCQRRRRRTVVFPPKNGGKPCSEFPLEQEEPCKSGSCVTDCQLNPWGEWSACSVTCGTGQKTRSRSVRKEPKNGGKACDSLTSTVNCKVSECPVDCQVGDWSQWSWDGTKRDNNDHSIFRAFGMKCTKLIGCRRMRNVIVPAQHGGKKCPPLTETSKPQLVCVGGCKRCSINQARLCLGPGMW